MVLWEIITGQLPFTEFSQFINRYEEIMSDSEINDPSSIKALGYRIEGNKKIREEFLVTRIKAAIIQVTNSYKSINQINKNSIKIQLK